MCSTVCRVGSVSRALRNVLISIVRVPFADSTFPAAHPCAGTPRSFCQQQCLGFDGGVVRCGCHAGYSLHADGRSCVRESHFTWLFSLRSNVNFLQVELELRHVSELLQPKIASRTTANSVCTVHCRLQRILYILYGNTIVMRWLCGSVSRELECSSERQRNERRQVASGRQRFSRRCDRHHCERCDRRVHYAYAHSTPNNSLLIQDRNLQEDALCAVCVPGTFGEHCEYRCADCANGAVCNRHLSGCACAAGWRGALCNERCPQGPTRSDSAASN